MHWSSFRTLVGWMLLVAAFAAGAFVDPGLSLADESQSSVPAQAPAAAPESGAAAAAERVAALKGSLQKDQAALRQYEWIETTVISMGGEEKARKQNRCYYGADGKLQKVGVGDQPTEKQKKGLRGKAAAGKKEDLTEYMAKVGEAIKTYIPPDPARVQAVKEAGNVSIQILEPGKRVRLDLKNYSVPGDVLGIEMDLTTNRLLGLNVTTLLEGDKEPVHFNTQFASLQDGTGYAQKTVLVAKEADVTVDVENSGYRKQAAQ